MTEYTLSPQTLVFVSGSSVGTQEKYYEDGYWYKINRNGYEGTAEYLVSLVLACSNVDNYVVYEPCTVNGRSGCRSKSFLQLDEKYISLHRLYSMAKGRDLTDDVMRIPDVAGREQYVIQFVRDVLGFDITEYLANILMLDALTLNNDRHFNNLGVVINETTDTVREAAIFDNGDSLLSNYAKFPPYKTIEQNLAHSIALPFSANAYHQAKLLPFTLSLDYEMLEEQLMSEPDSRAVQVLQHQLELFRTIIPNMDGRIDERAGLEEMER